MSEYKFPPLPEHSPPPPPRWIALLNSLAGFLLVLLRVSIKLFLVGIVLIVALIGALVWRK